MPLNLKAEWQLIQDYQSGKYAFESLPIFNGMGPEVIKVGFSYILSGYPKAGKTELMYSWVQSWCEQYDKKVVWISEESEPILADRVAASGISTQGKLLLGDLMSGARDDILQIFPFHNPDVLVIDTDKILSITDTSSESQVWETLTPIITASRAYNCTLFLMHHNNKSWSEEFGSHGRVMSGSHAYQGIVDGYFVLKHIARKPNQREIEGGGRRVVVPTFRYEMTSLSPMTFAYLGESDGAGGSTLQDNLITMLGMRPQGATRTEIMAALPVPVAERTLTAALNRAIDDGEVVRDPPETKQGVTYRYFKA